MMMDDGGDVRESSLKRTEKMWYHMKGFDPRRGRWSARRLSLCLLLRKITRPQSDRTCASSQLSTETGKMIIECVGNVEWFLYNIILYPSDGGEWLINCWWKGRWLFDAYMAIGKKRGTCSSDHFSFCRNKMSGGGAKLWTFTIADKCSSQTSEAWKFMIANVHTEKRSSWWPHARQFVNIPKWCH